MKTGTSSLIVAAFVGPGTVLTCATAGVGFGYGLGWVLLFATAAVFVLQSFTAGTGILAGKGLGEAIREAADTPVRRGVMFTLVVLGLWVGCAAFETGNLIGAASGVQVVLGLEAGGEVVMALRGAACSCHQCSISRHYTLPIAPPSPDDRRPSSPSIRPAW
jgi:Mn2+/Fe2+ NRAMP family transporter